MRGLRKSSEERAFFTAEAIASVAVLRTICCLCFPDAKSWQLSVGPVRNGRSLLALCVQRPCQWKRYPVARIAHVLRMMEVSERARCLREARAAIRSDPDMREFVRVYPVLLTETLARGVLARAAASLIRVFDLPERPEGTEQMWRTEHVNFLDALIDKTGEHRGRLMLTFERLYGLAREFVEESQLHRYNVIEELYAWIGKHVRLSFNWRLADQTLRTRSALNPPRARNITPVRHWKSVDNYLLKLSKAANQRAAPFVPQENTKFRKSALTSRNLSRLPPEPLAVSLAEIPPQVAAVWEAIASARNFHLVQKSIPFKAKDFYTDPWSIDDSLRIHDLSRK